jgi:gliding motility-associated-like protein
MRRLIYILLISLLPGAVFSQAGLCPPNLDFEMGDFTNWVCRTGNVFGTGGINTITWSGTGQVFNQHTIIPAATAGTDPYGGFPQVCPNGSNFSVKLGNNSGGHGAESISYTYTIPASLTTFSMMFHYAVVFQDPNHQPWEQPRFRARITDLSTGAPINCVNFDFTASGSLPGFLPSPVAPGVLYKGWTPITINLTPYIGRTIQLEFITSDCTFTAHFGYAYVDVNTNCNGAIAGTTICQGDNQITLTAPYGFQSYEWYADNSFSNLISTSQNLLMNPAPAVGTVIPVIVTPFAGFGCKDTLYATITVSQKPNSVAGPDVSICKNGQIQIGGPPVATYTYDWTPATQVSNPRASNPLAWNIPPNPQEFIVKTTDILTGCFSYDTVVVTNSTIDTAIRSSGNNNFCEDKAPPTLSVNPGLTSVQWYNGNTPIPGATSSTYIPSVSGVYWARVVQGLCTDSTAFMPVTIYPLPLASFRVNKDTGCITNNNFQFTNTSNIAGLATLSYLWKFSDGNTQQVTDASRIFSQPGTYQVELHATSSDGCKDTAYSTVYVMPNATANFSFDSICTSKPIQFRNLSSENGSPSVSYLWNFNNGGPPVTVKNPGPVVYTTGGPNTVSLQLTALGCESSPVSVTKPIMVHAAPLAQRYRDLTVPQGSSAYIHARDLPGGVYTWRPQSQLSSYNSRYTEFYATGNDVMYLIDILDKHSCVTTDTMLVQVLKKTGFYLPTAFTPNRDGLNDVVKPYLVGMKSLKSFSIFNRWGDRLFYSTKYGEGWNGKVNGVDQNAGVYVWILEFFDMNDKLIIEKGTIALIR